MSGDQNDSQGARKSPTGMAKTPCETIEGEANREEREDDVMDSETIYERCHAIAAYVCARERRESEMNVRQRLRDRVLSMCPCTYVLCMDAFSCESFGDIK